MDDLGQLQRDGAAWPQIGTFTNFPTGPGQLAIDPGHPSDATYGRVATITVAGTSQSVTMPGTEFYDDLGLNSDLFSITGINGSSVSIEGQGWGHGIGMGQWGALGYATGQDNGEGNWTYSQIVTHYYGPATLSTLPGSSGQPSGGVGGYWINASDGGVFSFGNAEFYGSTGGMRLNAPVVGMASTHDAGGYWEVTTDGGVFSFGDAAFYGSTGSIRLNRPMVGMAVTPDGGGYWLVASDGGIFAYGDAGFYGSTGSLVLNKPVIGMVPTHNGRGYWLIASDGGVFAFGDAGFFGSLGGAPPSTALVGVAPTPDGGGVLGPRCERHGLPLRRRPGGRGLCALAVARCDEERNVRSDPRLQRPGLRRGQRQWTGVRVRRCALLRGCHDRGARLLRPRRGHRCHALLVHRSQCQGEPHVGVSRRYCNVDCT